MFHVKIAQMQYFLFVFPRRLRLREAIEGKKSIGHTFFMFSLCWAARAYVSLLGVKESTNLIGDDGKQLTSSCNRKPRCNAKDN